MTDDRTLGTQATENKKNQDVPSDTTRADSSEFDRSIKNLSTIVKLTKSKRLKLANSDLLKAKANSFGTDFLTLGAKKAFIYLQKAFIGALFLRHFDLEHHIWIETDALGYTIGRVLSQMILNHLDQLFSNYVTHKNLNLIFSKFKIG